jgi:single-strand DNA-binding protein
MGAQQITITGNLTKDPEFTRMDGGAALCRLTVAANEKYRDKTGEWKDGDSFFADVSCWRDLAERVGTSLHKGDRVIVTGHLKSRRWEKEDGSYGYATGIEADDVAASCRFANVAIQRLTKTGTGLVVTATGELVGAVR